MTGAHYDSRALGGECVLGWGLYLKYVLSCFVFPKDRICVTEDGRILTLFDMNTSGTR